MEKNNRKKLTYLVRHGKYEKYSEDESLNFEGELEVFATGEKIREELDQFEEVGLVKIFSSPVHRAKQSANILSDSLSMYKPILSTTYAIDLGDGGPRSAKKLIADENYDIGIFVTHQPNIKELTGRSLKTGQYMRYKYK